MSSLASLKLPWCCSCCTWSCCPSKQDKWGHHAKRKAGCTVSRESMEGRIPVQSTEGRTGCAQDISPGYLTYLVGSYGNITFYSHPSNSSSHWLLWQSPPDGIFSAHRYHLKVLKSFYLQHLCVPKKSVQEPLWPCIKLLQLMLNNSCHFH